MKTLKSKSTKSSMLGVLLFWRMFFILFIFFLGCNQPTEMQSSFLPNSSPQNVVHNMISAYNEQNTVEYLNCLANGFQFSSSNTGSWDKGAEEFIHRKMFSQELSIELKLHPSSKQDDFPQSSDADYLYYSTLKSTTTLMF